MDTLVGFGIFGGILWAVCYALYRVHRNGQWLGAQKAYTAITRGIGSHCDTADEQVPQKLAEAIDRSKTARDVEDLTAKLWTVGNEMGHACWGKGYDYANATSRPADGVVHLELTQQEVLELRWAAHVGFEYAMMANTPATYQHGTEREAEAATRVIEKLERKIPKDPDDDDPHALAFNRQTMIWQKWPNGHQRNA